MSLWWGKTKWKIKNVKQLPNNVGVLVEICDLTGVSKVELLVSLMVNSHLKTLYKNEENNRQSSVS